MQICCFGFEQHRGPWAVFSAAFHHTERAPRVTSSLTAESPTIRSFKPSWVSIQEFSPPVACTLGRLVNEMHDCEMHARDTIPIAKMDKPSAQIIGLACWDWCGMTPRLTTVR